LNAAPDLRRTNTGWLSRPERRLVNALAPHVPLSMSPNRLTFLGFFAAVLAAAGYALVPHTSAALWLVNLALLINWFGDSLDGAVARARGIDRPRFGFFLDQGVDVASQAVFVTGLCLSGLVRTDVAAIGLATHLMLTVQSLLYAQATGTFRLSVGGFGLTEVRCMFFAGNVAFYIWPPVPFAFAGTVCSYADLLGILIIVGNICLFTVALVTDLRRLAKIDERSDTEHPD
jgi:phosphatidylglycerophosphate synthase